MNNIPDKPITDSTAAVSGDEMLKLDNQLCFALYVCSKEIIRKYKPILDPYGLTYTGYITLLALWEADGVTVKDLGSRLYLDSGTLTPLLKKLEAQGYIERTRSAADERNVVIKLTERGRELKIDAYQIPKDLICSTHLEAIDAYSLLTNLHRFMEQIIDS
ncbi:MarR family transcriptional regulator [Anaerocolumna sp. AGMB13025]|uniref:MarR family winged helix-turn-helix transcriptional regulator n=1 Tax=Anaerocolumna sp. AGMB13025 TaxID=3039116 RepID=UPI00241DBF94|nr:MarR family transcriptional regulator [Anaerocolumna sp. AGMB13025]WFR55332.1 MarR family transcriptional regulator [Anaerocolumna sp. AGMB13025]